ncbi:hypothetical protein HDV63DRAFT_415217 [Trichoderma sp. SZMC 28014]
MPDNRRVHFPDLPPLDDGVQAPLKSILRVTYSLNRNLDRVNNDSVARRSDCECQNYRTNDPTDAWAGQFNIPTGAETLMRMTGVNQIPSRRESLMEATNMNALNYESLMQLGRINHSNAMAIHEAAIEEAFRAESAEEVFDTINTSMGFTDFGFSHEIERSRTMKKFTTTKTSKRRTVRNSRGTPSQPAIQMYKKVDTVELQTWFEDEDCYVAAADAVVFCDHTRRRTHRS